MYVFCSVTEVIWAKTLQASIYLIRTFTRDQSSASRYAFFQKLAYCLYVSDAIFYMAVHGKKHFQSTIVRWDFDKLVILIA